MGVCLRLGFKFQSVIMRTMSDSKAQQTMHTLVHETGNVPREDLDRGIEKAFAGLGAKFISDPSGIKVNSSDTQTMVAVWYG